MKLSALLAGLLGVAALLAALLFQALAASGIGSMTLAGVDQALSGIALVTALFGVASLLGAVGLLAGASWARPIVAVLHTIGILGTVTAIGFGGVSTPLMVGLALTVLGLLATVLSDVQPGRTSTAGA